MTAPDPTPTLVVFALGADADCTRRPLLPGSLRSLETRLRQHCLESALQAGRELGWRLVVSTPGDLDLADDVERLRQSQGRFGDRLEDTLHRVAERFDGPLLVVGSDTPGLAADHLRRALERLEQSPEEVVLGPSPDGGFYLLATRRGLGVELSRVRWCHRSTLATLRSALEASGRRVHLLSPLGDLDDRRDLEAWLALRAASAAACRRLVREIRRALAVLNRPLSHPDWIALQPAFVPIPANRPPPG